MHKRTTTYARTLLAVLLYGGDRQAQMGGPTSKRFRASPLTRTVPDRWSVGIP